MEKVLIQFLSQLKELTKNQIKELASLMTVSEVKKNTVIVAHGQLCNRCFFVLKGGLRQFNLKGGIEKTIAFYAEEQAVTFISEQTSQKPSDSVLVSLEDSVLLVGDLGKDQDLFMKFPILVDITRKMIEADLGKTQDSFAKFIASSPEERYLNFMKEKKDLLNKVPQHMIASYLGMTPVSLSRIRKRAVLK